jgi:hypothetical protein
MINSTVSSTITGSRADSLPFLAIFTDGYSLTESIILVLGNLQYRFTNSHVRDQFVKQCYTFPIIHKIFFLFENIF